MDIAERKFQPSMCVILHILYSKIEVEYKNKSANMFMQTKIECIYQLKIEGMRIKRVIKNNKER